MPPLPYQFTVREVNADGEIDEDDEGDNDEYQLEDMEVVEGDFMLPSLGGAADVGR
jgi:hypothetical protein